MTMYEQSQQSDWLQTELESMSSQADSPAKTSQSQETKQAYKMEPEAGYGQSAPVLLATLNHASLSWKTSQISLVATADDGLEDYLETWPRSGMTRNGTAFQLATLEPSTGGTEYGSLLTPQAQGWKAWTFRNPYALIRKNHADGNLQEQLMRLYQRMITPECEEILMGFPKSWTDLNA